MKILIVLTYYRPHISGLTIYAERLAQAFSARGHAVTVLTSQFESQLPLEELDQGVRIVRVPVLFRLSKGVVMPKFGAIANRLVAQTDVIQLHLPQFDAAGIAFRGRILRKPTVITYHCDLHLPPGFLNRIANLGIMMMNQLTALFTHRIVTYTLDYAEHSPYLRKSIRKLKIIPPPVILPSVTQTEIKAFARLNNPKDHRPVIGMAARFATEKGVEILLKALPRILEIYPEAQVEFVGPFQNIIGEEKYFERLEPIIQQYQARGNWKFLGSLNPHDMAAFFSNLDVLVLPSLNSTEAFGLVQIEAMIKGIPCVVSSLPGVRQPVITHQMGTIFEIGDDLGLAEAVLDIVKQGKSRFSHESDFSIYSPDRVAQAYENLFSEISKTIR
ncbi:MAG: glycosyltransferase family 4 protein [Chloroflexi bacterium]|nr:glycosyltransferase family 4 protein [Chloroflexota bacterium]